MHKKKHKLFVNNSIPIHKTLYSKKYLVFYSIPLSCTIALLLLGVITINPNLGDLLVGKSSAITIRDEWVVKGNTDTNNSDNSESSNTTSITSNSDSNGSSSPNGGFDFDNNSLTDGLDEEFGGFGGDEVDSNDSAGLSQSDQDAGISLMSVTPTPTLAITIGNTDQVINTAQGGETAYGSYTIGLTGSNVKDYTLSIRASSTNLTMPSGASSSTSTISGAGGKTGSNMSTNTWGYAITNTSTTNLAGLTYKSLSTSDTDLISKTTVASPYNLSATKKLVFAAKFAETAATGLYKGSITLSLSATPAQTGQLWSNGTPSFITDMQDISSGFCKNNSKITTGTTITLKDSRQSGVNSYKIVKLKDGNCWMQENLRLGGTSAVSLTISDTNIAKNYTLPASSDSSWATSDSGTGQIRVGKTGMTVSNSYPGNGNGWQSNYGNYYSWCAATAGTCSESTADNVNVSGSICPKGWHLPSGGGPSNTGSNTGQNSEFYKLLNGLNMSTITASPYSFLTAGSIYSDNLRAPGTHGYYWSRTSQSSAYAYRMSFSSSDFYPGTDYNARYGGYSVRCVATY